MRRLLAVIGSALVLAASAACSDSKTPPAYRLPTERARELETALPGKSVTIGEVGYTAIGLRTKIVSVVGSHADMLAKGQFVRIRVAMVNHGKERHGLDLYKQLLVTGDGQTHPLSYDAMEVSRGPDGPFSIASQEVREVDLWFDVPANATLRALRVVGDPSSSRLSDQLSGTNVPGSTGTADLSLSTHKDH
jgi:hypothetical protein